MRGAECPHERRSDPRGRASIGHRIITDRLSRKVLFRTECFGFVEKGTPPDHSCRRSPLGRLLRLGQRESHEHPGCEQRWQDRLNEHRQSRRFQAVPKAVVEQKSPFWMRRQRRQARYPWRSGELENNGDPLRTLAMEAAKIKTRAAVQTIDDRRNAFCERSEHSSSVGLIEILSIGEPKILVGRKSERLLSSRIARNGCLDACCRLIVTNLQADRITATVSNY